MSLNKTRKRAIKKAERVLFYHEEENLYREWILNCVAPANIV